MLAGKRRDAFKEFSRKEANVYFFCLRCLLRFSVKYVGKMKLIQCMLLMHKIVEIVLCDFCMSLKTTCTFRETAETKQICRS